MGLVALLIGPRPLAPAEITVGGACNLVAAIAAANTDSSVGGCPPGSGTDTILLPTNATLTGVHNFTDGANGLPSVTSVITIQGYDTTIERSSGAPDFRILHVSAGGDLTLENVEITGGDATVSTEGRVGGGIFNLGTLALVHSTVSDNDAFGPSNARGGGIYNGGVTHITESTIRSNLAYATTDPMRADGGGIFNAPGGQLVIKASTISNNYAFSETADARGGGIASRSTSPGSFVVHDSTIADNDAFVFLEKSPDIFRAAYGGGILADDLRLYNSTISGNQAGVAEPGSYTFEAGGGIYMDSGVVRHTTFEGNFLTYQGFGGGALAAYTGTYVSGSLFANSSPGHCSGTFTDAGGGNLADDATCALTIAGTLTGLDPTLADNGGPTATHALLMGSTAIDISGGCGLSSDQRGAGRIAPCDSGAFEDIGCAILELDSQVIDGMSSHATCNTALLGPDLIVEGPGGDLTVTAGYRATLKNGFVAELDSEVEIGVDPSLLPP